MSRPPLPIGTAGEVNTYATRCGYRAVCKYRDYDGVTRLVERHGRTTAHARRRLREAIRDRSRAGSSTDITPDTFIRDLAEFWYAETQDRDLSPNTLQAYRDRLDKQVIPSMGALRIREATVSRVDRLIKATKQH